jgi:hypothetical protein
MGSHITWMLFALQATYSKFCKDGLMMANWPYTVGEVKKKYTEVFDWNQKLFCFINNKLFPLRKF